MIPPSLTASMYGFGSDLEYIILTHYLVVLLDENAVEFTEEEVEEEEDDDEPLFIPFPGFTRTIEPLPYRGSDPEWETYVKVSRNEALLISMRARLADMACATVARHPVLCARFGKDVKVARYWLTIQYPFRPPPTLSIGGGNGITWAEQPVDPVAVSWTRQALWPSAVTLSLWSFTNALLRQNVTAIANFFGYESQTDPISNMQQAIEKINRQITRQPGKPSPALPAPPSQDRTGEGSSGSSLPPVDKQSTGSTTTPETLGRGASMGDAVPTVPSAKDMYMIRTAQEHTSGPWDKFKQSLAKKWRAPMSYPPRGSIRVSGLVEIDSPHYALMVDCVGWWDPQTEKYDLRTLTLQLRGVRPKKQSPLR
ncbi:hypothetical protein O1611_g8722 [Lasiodiplodia mahajangana]|uniref:Uncharacterized protein n=1 Tax=Lasiodiplodia mahajangana TaxID=1108764 RepID=A0ACC2JCJ4_9PEZI|nr:hypothetical protein O1611_g8722 [Lasiodiplodia mahajangana]